MSAPDPAFWSGRRVFLTGHTGFKGSWATLLLHRLGARVAGYSLPGPVTEPDLFYAAKLDALCDDRRGDIRDLPRLRAAVVEAQPEIVVHLAAQPIVRAGVRDPIETFDINVMGVAKVLEAARGVESVRVILIVTSDKCYDNKERLWAYREDEAMGGHDPYSASKGCAELTAAAFAHTYFRGEGARVASVRAGNVIGGGDWAEDRLIPDLARAALARRTVEIRSPTAVRPWQHVLDPVGGYLCAAEHVWNDTAWSGFDAWNFGPNPGDELTVREVVEAFQPMWDGAPGAQFAPLDRDAARLRQEAGLLRVDNTKAKIELGWRPTLSNRDAIAASARWYRAVSGGDDARVWTERQIEEILNV